MNCLKSFIVRIRAAPYYYASNDFFSSLTRTLTVLNITRPATSLTQMTTRLNFYHSYWLCSIKESLFPMQQ